jgi:chemotaxis family two-component system sensor histidine kinase/response regulator PixL
MSLNPDIRDQAYQFFIEEAQELLQILEQGLLNLQQERSTAKIHELMRAAHSIKGGAASVELEAIKILAHRLEDFFKALYSDSVEFNSELERLLLQGYDCLRDPLVQQMETGCFDREAALATAEPIFSALEVILGDALKEADSYIPSATDLGVDIIASIFEVDVAQSLNRLSEVVDNPEQYEVAEELRAQLDIFGGFAELFNLPGLSEILQTAQTALTNYPDRALEIAKLTIADCHLAREMVLNGDRDRGGEVSQALKNIAVGASSTTGWEAEEEFAEANENNWFPDSEIDPDAPSFSEIFNAAPHHKPKQTFAASIQESEVFGVDDVFGEIPDADDTFSQEVDDVFGEIPDTEDTFSQESVDDVFGEIPDAEDTFSQEVDDVFGEIPDTDDTFSQESVDDVFGEIPDAEDTVSAANSSIDDVFNTIPDSEDLDRNLTTPASETEFAQPQNIEAAIDSITNIFDRLPELKPNIEEQPKSIKHEKTKESSAPAKIPVVAANLSVRVDLDRLERMNNTIGELTINRNSLSLQNEQLQDSVLELSKKFTRFRGFTNKLREISDLISIESKPNSNTFNLESDFDSLELDSYNQLYSLVQGILEEIVQLEESVEDIAIFAKQSNLTIQSQRQMMRQIRDELMWARMLPLEQILHRFPRTLRDLSSKYKKPVQLDLSGTEVLVDKAVLEKLYDPLLHLLRNGFDHGIEAPEIRRQQGKPEQGLIAINAYYQGNQTVIEIKDDGQGLNVEKIAKKAVKTGLLSAPQIANASKEDLYNLIFEPGFSTADKVSELSGRGVGMNVVRSQLEALKGTIEVDSDLGKGTTFTLRLPLTLTISKLLVCSIGTTAFALPSDSIEEIIIPLAEQIKISGDSRFLLWHQQLISIYSAKDLLQHNCTIPHTNSNSKALETIATPKGWALPLLLLRRGQELFALEIESLINEQELVIKPLGKELPAPSYTYGCTILSDGTLIPVINGASLIDATCGTTNYDRPANVTSNELQIEEEVAEGLIGSTKTRSQALAVKTIMIIDDSTALRRTMALSLEKQGYYVIQGKDGRDALDKLQQNSKVDLIVCDIEMPHMNGFEFLGMRRRDSQLEKIPVIMLTSRSGDKHRNLAMQLGANGYFTKPYIEQDFLAELKRMLQTKESSTTRVIPVAKTPTKQTILVIDDSSALRKTMAATLENKGYRVLQARDGVEGLEVLENNPQINLVICDIEMPNMNGFEFLTSRRQKPQLTKIPVAMLTSRSGEKHRLLAQQLGAEASFTKPYVEETFIAALERMLSKKK